MREHWFVQRGPNGGLVAALATRALTEVAGGDGRAPRSLTLHYLAPPVAGELEVAAAVERAGRTTTFASLRVLQDGVTVAYGLGCCSAWREGQPEWDELERPDVPGPAEIASLEPADGVPRFLSNYEMRPLDAPHVGAWMRAAAAAPGRPGAARRAHRRVDPGRVRAHGAADLRPHHRPHDPLARARPASRPASTRGCSGVFSTRLGAGGTWEEDGELWSEDGVLLAQSRQLAIVRDPR